MRVESPTLHLTSPFWLFDLANKVLDSGYDNETRTRFLKPCGGIGL